MTASPPARCVDGVLLDIDDTIIDTRAAFAQALDHVFGVWLPHLDGVQRRAALLHWARDPGGHFRAFTRGEVSFAAQRRLRAEALHAAFEGPRLDDAAFAEWESGYEAAFRAAWRALPDGVALVALLRERGIPFGALTNMGASYQREKLDAVGFGDVEILVTTDDLGRGKPDPAVFHLACERLGLPPGRVAYVGDELDVDARGARDAGLVGVWVDRHGTGDRPGDVAVVTSLHDLPAVVGLTVVPPA